MKWTSLKLTSLKTMSLKMGSAAALGRAAEDGSATSKVGQRMLALWQRIARFSRRRPRTLRLCESLALGDRRFVAVIECGQSRFLLGGTPSSLVLLARLGEGGWETSAEPPAPVAPAPFAASATSNVAISNPAFSNPAIAMTEVRP